MTKKIPCPRTWPDCSEDGCYLCGGEGEYDAAPIQLSSRLPRTRPCIIVDVLVWACCIVFSVAVAGSYLLATF